jgi:hypothetical protein
MNWKKIDKRWRISSNKLPPHNSSYPLSSYFSNDMPRLGVYVKWEAIYPKEKKMKETKEGKGKWGHSEPLFPKQTVPLSRAVHGYHSTL